MKIQRSGGCWGLGRRALPVKPCSGRVARFPLLDSAAVVEVVFGLLVMSWPSNVLAADRKRVRGNAGGRKTWVMMDPARAMSSMMPVPMEVELEVIDFPGLGCFQLLDRPAPFFQSARSCLPKMLPCLILRCRSLSGRTGRRTLSARAAKEGTFSLISYREQDCFFAGEGGGALAAVWGVFFGRALWPIFVPFESASLDRRWKKRQCGNGKSFVMGGWGAAVSDERRVPRSEGFQSSFQQ